MLTFICYMSLFKVSQLHSFCFINGLSLQPCLYLPHIKGGEEKKKKEKEIKRASFICQVWYDPTRDNASNSPVYKAQLATSIHIIFFLAVFDIEVLHAELDETWLKHLL